MASESDGRVLLTHCHSKKKAFGPAVFSREGAVCHDTPSVYCRHDRDAGNRSAGARANRPFGLSDHPMRTNGAGIWQIGYVRQLDHTPGIFVIIITFQFREIVICLMNSRPWRTFIS